MGLSTPQSIYGIHNFTFFNRTTRVPVGILKVIGNANIALSGSFNDLFGGSSRFPWDSEAGVLDTTISLNTKQFETFLFEKALGATSTTESADTTGDVSTLTNQKGTSVVASTGIATATIKSGGNAELKTGLYVVKAVSATTVDVYCMSDIDFDVGTDKTFVNDTLKITASPLTITQSMAVEIPDFGVELTGGAGTIALVADDTAYFYVRKINAGAHLITVGSSNQSFSEFGVLWTAQRKSNGDVFELFAPRVKAIGMPLPLSEQAWATADISMKCLYDSSEDCVYKVRRVLGA
jgi:hypothetical protein